MAERILGIIGPGNGPKVSTARLKRPVLKIVGMKTGLVQVTSIGSNPWVRGFDSCGTYELEPSEFMQVQYDGQCKTTVCTIHAGKLNAVYSP